VPGRQWRGLCNFGTATLWQSACELGDAGGCTLFGNAMWLGSGVHEDHAKALALFGRGCDGGDPRGCHELALSYDSGEGVPRDAEHAVRLYGRACTGGLREACQKLRDIVERPQSP
jgi:hypothetical protein